MRAFVTDVRKQHIDYKFKKFRAEGLDVELFAVSPADARAEAFSNQDNQVYFGKGEIALREGKCCTLPTVRRGKPWNGAVTIG